MGLECFQNFLIVCSRPFLGQASITFLELFHKKVCLITVKEQNISTFLVLFGNHYKNVPTRGPGLILHCYGNDHCQECN